jgi:CRISPR-associated protein Cmr4
MTEIIGLLAETYIHPGTGQAAGAIDLPVARERVTQYPFIPGSSMKGALLDAARGDGLDKKRLDDLFGKQEKAGQLLISDARLLLLPVRSLSHPYVWLTCPYLIERLRRDLARGDMARAGEGPAKLADDEALATGERELFLEERLFSIKGPSPAGLIEEIGVLIAHDDARARLGRQLAVVSDNAFSWFAQYALPVQARNALDSETKTTKPGALWYEEALPPDTLMYFVLGERTDGAAAALAGHLAQRRYLQAGGNETVGQGWFAVHRVDGATP